MKKTLFSLFIIFFSNLFFTPLNTSARIIVCESFGNDYNFCPARLRGGDVYLSRQLSKDPCIRGRTWGIDRERGGIWVDRGCRAEFRIERVDTWDRPPRPDSFDLDRPRREIITCESFGNRYNYCPVKIFGDVRLIRNLSETDCRRGRNWGYDSGGIWVDNGCRGQFEINFR